MLRQCLKWFFLCFGNLSCCTHLVSVFLVYCLSMRFWKLKSLYPLPPTPQKKWFYTTCISFLPTHKDHLSNLFRFPLKSRTRSSLNFFCVFSRKKIPRKYFFKSKVRFFIVKWDFNSLNFIRLLQVVFTPSVGENDSKQSDEFQARTFKRFLWFLDDNV